METNGSFRDLVIKYLEGKISPEEESSLFGLLGRSGGMMAGFRKIQTEWAAQGKLDKDTENSLNELRRRINARAAVPAITSGRWLWPAISVAASVILTASALIFWRMERAGEPMYCEVHTENGERCRVTLPDGSIASLNSGTRIRYQYQSRFGKKSPRQVDLEGEAFFEVAKKERQNFVVKTSGYDVEVTGTKFNVSAYPEDSLVTTYLVQGAVNVHYAGGELKMVPGDVLALDIRKGRLERYRTGERHSSIAWYEHRVEYDDITLATLAERLSRQFGVNIHVETDKWKDSHFSISLRNGETIEDVLDALGDILPIEITHKSKDIYIK